MKVEDLRRQKPCYIHNLHVGDTFLLEGELYYVFICNDTERTIGTINLTTNSIHYATSKYLELPILFIFVTYIFITTVLDA